MCKLKPPLALPPNWVPAPSNSPSLSHARSAGPLIKGPPGCEAVAVSCILYHMHPFIPACFDFSMPACLYAVFCILYLVVCSHTVRRSADLEPTFYHPFCSFPQLLGPYVRIYICMHVCTSCPPPRPQPADLQPVSIVNHLCRCRTYERSFCMH